jgi:hypothetical protein
MKKLYACKICGNVMKKLSHQVIEFLSAVGNQCNSWKIRKLLHAQLLREVSQIILL